MTASASDFGKREVLIVDIMNMQHVYLQRHAEIRAREYGAAGADSGTFRVFGSAVAESAATILAAFDAALAAP